jgi:hypothetical protein
MSGISDIICREERLVEREACARGLHPSIRKTSRQMGGHMPKNPQNSIAMLEEKLIDFGLEPRQWRIKFKATGRADLEHRADPELKLAGLVREGEWLQLEWII